MAVEGVWGTFIVLVSFICHNNQVCNTFIPVGVSYIEENITIHDDFSEVKIYEKVKNRF